jgi:hypothetical protein
MMCRVRFATLRNRDRGRDLLKMRNLSSTVEIVERETRMTAEIKDINRPPVWEKPRARPAQT